MYIKSVDIHNYRGFTESHIDFHPKLNVFIGSNASGKTTLLRGLVKAIYKITGAFVSGRDNLSDLILNNDDIKYDELYCSFGIVISGFPDYSQDINSVITANLPGSVIQNNTSIKKVPSIDHFLMWFNNQIKNSFKTIPIFKYYPANRGAIAYAQQVSNQRYTISQIEAWSNIYQGQLSYSRFFHWFFDNETNELRLQRDAKDFSLESPSLKGVRLALKKAFKLLNYGEVNIKTKQLNRSDSNKLIPTLVIENVNTKRSDQIDSKSDGEKAIITLIADIAYNLSIAKDFTIDDNFLSSPGVVLIDEIESHLHPTWQREIVPILTELFTNVQFFVSTHSPQVISSVNSESVFVCQDFDVRQIKLKTKGEDTNTLLKYIFNSTERPKEYIKILEDFDHLIETNAELLLIEQKINEIREIESLDKSTDINVLINELLLRYEAYKFEREYETDK